MKRTATLLLVLAAGCSTAPLADVLDLVRPGRIGPGPYRGGVGAQHNPPGPPAATELPPATLPPGPPVPLPSAVPPVVPPPAGATPVP